MHAWYLHPKGWTLASRKQRPTVLFFQENAGNMSFRLPFLRLLARYLDCSIFAPRLLQCPRCTRDLEMSARFLFSGLCSTEVFTVILMRQCVRSYRGYGRSQGQPSEAGIKLDAQAALDHLLQRPDVDKDLVRVPPCLLQKVV